MNKVDIFVRNGAKAYMKNPRAFSEENPRNGFYEI
jgi:hypothetical protein